ncbi:MAG: ribonuclease HI [Clostridia bacterium]
MKNIIIYTDGACSGNPGPGGWGAVLIYENNEKEISGSQNDTTNNRMELTAVIEALKMLKEKCNVKIHSDSAYVVNAFDKEWITSWKQNNWKTAGKQPVKNDDLWRELDLLVLEQNIVEFIKVKGHSTNKYNNVCDKLATDAIKRI